MLCDDKSLRNIIWLTYVGGYEWVLSVLSSCCRVASNILLDMMLQQRHERAMEELEQEMKVELQRCRDKMNAELNEQMMAALSVRFTHILCLCHKTWYIDLNVYQGRFLLPYDFLSCYVINSVIIIQQVKLVPCGPPNLEVGQIDEIL